MSALQSVAPDGTVNWSRGDLPGPVADVSFSPTGEPVLLLDDRRTDGHYRPSLSVLSTSGQTLRSRDLFNEDVIPRDVEYGGDGFIYVHGSLNRSVIESFRYSDLQPVDQTSVGVGRLASRQSTLTYVDWASGSATFFTSASGSLQQKTQRSVAGRYRRASIDPAGNVFGLTGSDTYACADASLTFSSPVSPSWSRSVAMYLGATSAIGCKSVDVEALPDGGAVVLVLLPSSGLRLIEVSPSGDFVRAIDRGFSQGSSTDERDPRHFEIEVDGAGNIVLVGIGLEKCTFDENSPLCGFLRVETLSPDGSSLDMSEKHGFRSNDDPNDDSYSLFDRRSTEYEVVGVNNGVILLVYALGNRECGNGCDGADTTEAFNFIGAHIERRYWEDPPMPKPPVEPTTSSSTSTSTSTSTSMSSTSSTSSTTSTTVSLRNIRISPDSGVQGTQFSISYSCPSRTAASVRFTDASGRPYTRGYQIGVVSQNNRDYSGNLTMYEPGVFTATLYCNASVAGSATVTVTARQPGTGKYVALGDSFSSGEGTFKYDENAIAKACHRGPAAWPRQLETDSAELGPIEHKACTGAKTRDLYSPQKGKGVLAQIPKTSQPDVGLVTITIGGNDVGFSGILIDCYRSNCDGVSRNSNFQVKKAELTEVLARVIYPALARAYPNARIVHVGYPRLTPLRGEDPVNCAWLNPDEQDEGDRLVNQINGAIQAAVGRQSRVEYADVTNALLRHELCTAESWVTEISPLVFNNDTEQGHPNAPGQDAYENAVAFALGLLGF